MSAKHTPAPWAVLPLDDKYYGTRVKIGDDEIRIWTPDHFAKPFASEREIAAGWESGDGHDHVEDVQSLANARLIAAAPELLKALKMCVIERGEWLDEAYAAIAKAEGYEVPA